MMDSNILNRASFEETVVPLELNCKPGKTETLNFPLGGHLCLQNAEWKYEVPGGQRDDYGWPKKPLRISLAGVFEDQAASPVNLAPPRIIKNSIQVKVLNPSAVAVILHLKLKGVKVSLVEGAPELTDKEILGYTMLDNSQKGMLALQEAAADRLDAHLKQLGIENGRELCLGGFDPQALKALTSGSEHPTNQLASDKTEEELVSLLVGDLVQFKLESNSDITIEELQSLAKYLLQKSWRK